MDEKSTRQLAVEEAVRDCRRPHHLLRGGERCTGCPYVKPIKLTGRMVDGQPATIKVELTRTLRQTLTVEIPAENLETDYQMGSRAVAESSAYFDTDWKTIDLKYSWEMIRHG